MCTLDDEPTGKGDNQVLLHVTELLYHYGMWFTLAVQSIEGVIFKSYEAIDFVQWVGYIEFTLEQSAGHDN